MGSWGRVAVVAAAVVAVAAVASIASASVEERPKYRVIRAHEGFELREYAERVEARVTVRGEYRDALNRGFRALGGYIFGGNVTGAEIQMTTPVTAVPADPSMAAEEWMVTFVMPSDWSLDTLPAPNDPRVQLVRIEGERLAVRGFGGNATVDRSAAEVAALVDAMSGAGLAPAGPPRIAQFDPPWIPGPLRTNEVLIPVRR